MKYVASCSFGKDSLAMVLMLIEKKRPLDEVIFYDTGMEFQAIYNNRDKLLPILQSNNIQYTEVHPKNEFTYTMLEKPVNGKNGYHIGYGWCGGTCRWGTTEKVQTLDKTIMVAPPLLYYIGIAADERPRLERLVLPKYSPLAEFGITEKMALDYCYANGWNWYEPTTSTDTGYIDLYEILDRVSCWCCANKNRKELYNIWRYLPQYWSKLKYLQSRIERPMKKFCCKEYGYYGNLFQLEKVFQQETENESSSR